MVYVVIAEDSYCANESWHSADEVYRTVAAYTDEQMAHDHARFAVERCREIHRQMLDAKHVAIGADRRTSVYALSSEEYRETYPNVYDPLYALSFYGGSHYDYAVVPVELREELPS